MKKITSLTVKILAEYFVVLYSSLAAVLIIVKGIISSFQEIVLLTAMSLLLILLRYVFQNQFVKLYKKYKTNFSISALAVFALSFSFTSHIYAVIFPEFMVRHLELTDVRKEVVVFVATAGVAILFMILVGLLLIQATQSLFKGNNFLSKSIIAFGLILCWVVIFAASGYFYSHPGQKELVNLVLEKVGYLIIGSIPIFQLRLLLFGNSKK